MVYIEITNACNFACEWCPTGNPVAKESKATGNMSIELFEKILKDFKAMVGLTGKKIKTMGLFWMGEPFLNKHVIEMIELAKSYEVAEKIIITTNGSLIDIKKAAALVKSGLDVLNVSFYGMSDSEYLKLNKKFTFTDIVNNLKHVKNVRTLQKTDVPLIVGKVFTHSLETEDVLIKKFACVDLVAVESPFNWNEDYTKLSGNHVAIEDMGPIKYCPSAWFVMSINWNGQVGVCCADWGNRISVGNLSTESVVDVWAGKKLQKFKQLVASGKYHMNPACRGCTYYKVSHDADTNIDSLIESNPTLACGIPALLV